MQGKIVPWPVSDKYSASTCLSTRPVAEGYSRGTRIQYFRDLRRRRTSMREFWYGAFCPGDQGLLTLNRRKHGVEGAGSLPFSWRSQAFFTALPLLASLGLAAPASAQVAVVPVGATLEPQEWIGGTGTDQWNNQNNWARPGSGGTIHDGVPLVIANFFGFNNNRTVRDQNSQS